MSGARKTHAVMSTLLVGVFALTCVGCGGGGGAHITAFAAARPRPSEARCTRLVTNKLGRPDGPAVARDACRKRFGWYLAEVINKARQSVWFHCMVEARNVLFGKLGVWTVPFNNQLDAPTELQGGTSVALTWFTPELSPVAAQTVDYRLHCKTVSPP